MTFETTKYGWVFKYKIHHLLFWTLYHFTWWTAYEGGVGSVINSLKEPLYLAKFLSLIIFQALGVYFCLYYLIPKFLEKGKLLLYIVLVLLTVLAIALAITGGYYLGLSFSSHEQDVAASLDYFFKKHALPSSMSSMTLGMSIKLAKNYLESQRRQQVLEKEKLETELKFLKSQFNPHFLFNTINSIFVLINKNTNQAKDALAKFSELLRYQLYECNESEIPLSRELTYLESFIELEKLRQDPNLEIQTRLLQQSTGNLAIAPFILMPFVENAFKHVSKTNEKSNWIHISLELTSNLFKFNISNSLSENSEKSQDAFKSNGLGLKNVQRRLELLYQHKHVLEVMNKNGVYSTSLEIELAPINNRNTLNQFT